MLEISSYDIGNIILSSCAIWMVLCGIAWIATANWMAKRETISTLQLSAILLGFVITGVSGLIAPGVPRFVEMEYGLNWAASTAYLLPCVSVFIVCMYYACTELDWRRKQPQNIISHPSV